MSRKCLNTFGFFACLLVLIVPINLSGMSSLSDRIVRKRVVIIGYGAAGSQVAAQLAKRRKYAITVVTPFEYMEVSLNMTRAVAGSGRDHDRCLFPLLAEKNVEYVTEACIKVVNGSITVASGRVIKYDVCIVATGQRIPIFYPNINESTMSLRKASIQKIHDDIEAANSVCVCGAGPVGAEFAADLKLRHKNKKVTLVFPHDVVLSMMSKPLPQMATQRLQDMGISVISNDRVEKFENGEVHLKSGVTLPADVYVPAFSTGGNSSFLSGVSVDARGYVIVDDTFEVNGLSNVFAIGDCSNYDSVKTYPRIDDQLPVLLHNVESRLKDPTQPLKHHVRGISFMGSLPGPLLVAFGHGVAEGWGVGPDFGPGCLDWLMWALPVIGWPCGAPAGHCSAYIKSCFNDCIVPRRGVGIHR